MSYLREVQRCDRVKLSHLTEKQDEEIRNISFKKSISFAEASHLYFSTDRKNNFVLDRWL
jgi:hypothetical protein